MILYIDKAIDGISYDFDFEAPVDQKLFDGRDAKSTSMKIVGKYMVEKNIVTTIGEITIEKVVLPCDRCLTPVDLSFNIPFEALFSKDGNDGMYLYEGWQVDLTDMINETVEFAIPSSVLCTEDCKGLCPVCGKNRNIESCNCESQNKKRNVFSVLLDEE